MFRNYDKIISASSLANRANKYIVHWRNKVVDPTPYYLHHLTDSQLSRDPFELSLLAHHLVRKAQADAKILSHYAEQNAKPSKFQKKLELETAYNNSVLESHVKELKRLISFNTHELTLQTAISTIYSIEKSGKSDTKFYEQYLVPELKQKLKYASLANLADLTEALTHAKFYADKDLWKQIADRLNEKSSAQNFKTVQYNGLSLDQYESVRAQKKKVVPVSENERYLADLKAGKTVADAKQEVRKAWDYLSNTWIHRLLFNEKRLSTQLDNFTDEVDHEALANNLNEAARNVSDISASVKSIVKNLQNESH